MRNALKLFVGGVLALGTFPAVTSAQHACDDLGDSGWRTEATVETVTSRDSAPFKVEAGTTEASGSWYVDRSITELPFCNYYNSLGNYSLRSYTLSPETRTVRVQICRAKGDGRVESIAPYAGKCPPS